MDLYNVYKESVVPKLMEEFQYTSIMQVPYFKKITINMGVGRAVSDKNVLEHAMKDLMMISSQKPVYTYVRKSIASFKIRKGQPIGCKVTLRGLRMWDFFERLIFIAIPRIRDFRGLSPKSFDSTGNYSLGIREQIIFPEIDYDKIDNIRGMDITITIFSQSYDESYALLSAFDFPFRL